MKHAFEPLLALTRIANGRKNEKQRICRDELVQIARKGLIDIGRGWSHRDIDLIKQESNLKE